MNTNTAPETAKGAITSTFSDAKNSISSTFENLEIKDTLTRSSNTVKSSKYTRPVLWTLGLGAAAYGLFRLYQFSTNRSEARKTGNWAEQLEVKLGGPEKSAKKPSSLILDRASDRGVKDIHAV